MNIFIPLFLLAMVAFLLSFVFVAKVRETAGLKWVFLALCAFIALFSIYGFLASFELPSPNIFHLIYGIVELLAIGGIIFAIKTK